jgi:hypothetical protein
MVDMSGEFELHLTANSFDADRLRAFADERSLKFSHIVLDRGDITSQPMITVPGTGALDDQIALGTRWTEELRAANIGCARIKVEAAPDNVGVPQGDDDAVDGRYFEHHVKLLLPDNDLVRRIELAQLITPYHARLSRNARRERSDGAQERFVTQRCYRAGRRNARALLDELLAVLRTTGYDILQIEEEYVAHDTGIGLDRGWLDADRAHEHDTRETKRRTASAGADHYPSTYQPIEDDRVRQRGYFDPALSHFPQAFQAGDPVFADEAVGKAWRAARWAAIAAVLEAVADSPFAGNLVLRGSVALRTIFGAAAREPGDLDFVVVQPTLSITSTQAGELLDGVTGAVRAAGAGVRADEVSIEDIWTYERAAGKRLLFPFEVDGLPRGFVQLDLVFHEPLPIPAEPILIEPLTVPVLAAPPALALAWKLQWLATDSAPQAKDLYDAMLLAEHTDVDPVLVRDLIQAELPRWASEFGPETVLSWPMDWNNLYDQCPDLPRDGHTWPDRLALAMTRFWR